MHSIATSHNFHPPLPKQWNTSEWMQKIKATRQAVVRTLQRASFYLPSTWEAEPLKGLKRDWIFQYQAFHSVDQTCISCSATKYLQPSWPGLDLTWLSWWTGSNWTGQDGIRRSYSAFRVPSVTWIHLLTLSLTVKWSPQSQSDCADQSPGWAAPASAPPACPACSPSAGEARSCSGAAHSPTPSITHHQAYTIVELRPFSPWNLRVVFKQGFHCTSKKQFRELESTYPNNVFHKAFPEGQPTANEPDVDDMVSQRHCVMAESAHNWGQDINPTWMNEKKVQQIN